MLDVMIEEDGKPVRAKAVLKLDDSKAGDGIVVSDSIGDVSELEGKIIAYQKHDAGEYLFREFCEQHGVDFLALVHPWDHTSASDAADRSEALVDVQRQEVSDATERFEAQVTQERVDGLLDPASLPLSGGDRAVGIAAAPSGTGYWVATASGDVQAMGGAADAGGLDTGEQVVAIAAAPGGGYWLLTAAGRVAAFGGAEDFGGLGSDVPTAAMVSLAAHPAGGGYWALDRAGGVHAFGSAADLGSAVDQPLAKVTRFVSTGDFDTVAVPPSEAPTEAVAILPTPTGEGYWLAAKDGGVFSYGDASFEGSAGGTKLNAPIVAMAATPTATASGPTGKWSVPVASFAARHTPYGYLPIDGIGQYNKSVQSMLFGGDSPLIAEGRMLTVQSRAIWGFGDAPRLEEALIEQHFTQPPPRFTEASLIKRMEELGIGRPSTYAATITVLQDRNYVRLEKRALIPEDRGRLVTAFLEKFFTRYVEFGFTASDLEATMKAKPREPSPEVDDDRPEHRRPFAGDRCGDRATARQRRLRRGARGRRGPSTGGGRTRPGRPRGACPGRRAARCGGAGQGPA